MGESEDPSNFAAIDIQSTWSSGNPTSPYGDTAPRDQMGMSGKYSHKLLCTPMEIIVLILPFRGAGDKDGDSVDDGTCPTGQLPEFRRSLYLPKQHQCILCSWICFKEIKSDGTLIVWLLQKLYSRRLAGTGLHRSLFCGASRLPNGQSIPVTPTRTSAVACDNGAS